MGSLGGLNALTVTPGEGVGEASHLWLAEELQSEGLGNGKERVDQFDASTGGGCSQPFEHTASLQELYRGIAVGRHTGEREVYLGAAERVEGSPARLGVLGPAGELQGAWTGADTPSGLFEGNVTGVAVDESGLAGDWASGDVIIGTANGGTHTGVVDVITPEVGGMEPPAEAGGVKDVWQLKGTCLTVGFACDLEEEVEHPFKGPKAVAVDQATGELFVGDSPAPGGGTEAVVDVFKPGLRGEYDFEGQLTPPPGVSFEDIVGVAVDSHDGDVYVVEQAESQLGGANVVYEFDIATGEPVDTLTGLSSASPFSRPTSVAVDQENGDVFVGDRGQEGSVVDVFGPDIIVPDTKTEEATEVTASTAVLNGTVNPLEAETGEGATCEFEYGSSTAYGQRVKCAQPVTSAEKVRSLTVAKLEPDTTYHFRLMASNNNGAHVGGDLTFTTKGPGIEAEFASDVTATSASLNSTVDPNGKEISYFFQYSGEDTEACTPSTCTAVPAEPGTGIGSGEEQLPEIQTVENLTPGRQYHYRVVTVSEVEVTPGHVEVHQFAGPDRTFTTQIAGEFILPDSRQWQLVSPPEKHGALIEALGQDSNEGEPIQAAANGSAITYLADVPTEAAPQGNSNHVQVFSARDPDGWSSHDLALPHTIPSASGEAGNEYRFFSEDLSTGIVQPFGRFDPGVSEDASEQTPFQHTNFFSGGPSEACANSCYSPLVTARPGVADDTASPFQSFGEYGPEEIEGHKAEGDGEEGNRCPPYTICGPVFVGASPDGAHVVVSSRVPLAEKAGAGSELYEWNREPTPSERLKLVSVLPASEGAGAVGAQLGNNSQDTRGAVSANGSRVFFTADGIDGHLHLYMRDVAAGKTLRLDVPEQACVNDGTCEAATGAPEFQFASREGERVLFKDATRLTGDSGAGRGKADLYECAIVEVAGEPTCILSDLTPKAAGKESADVQGEVPGASEDGAWVYFVADGVLGNSSGERVPGATPGSCHGSAPSAESACNLYVRHEGVTRLVAVLSGADNPDWAQSGTSLEHLVARVAPNGQWLAFMSDRSLTGYDNRDAASGERDEEIYLYDAKTAQLVCASCDPSGALPVGQEYGPSGNNMPHVSGNRVWESSSWLAADVPAWTPYQISDARYQSRFLSNNGRLFFNARDPLVPRAVNNTWDVYEYEPEGEGSEAAKCGPSAASGSEAFKPAVAFEAEGFTREEGAGCVALISSGESSDESAFLDASATGGDVFFLTTAKLSTRDVDDSYDVYDAHECTASTPCMPALAELPPPCATADSCRTAPAPQPSIFGPGPTETLVSTGNSAAALSAKPIRKTAAQVRAEKLAAALKICRKKYPKSKKRRAACGRQAQKKYGFVETKAQKARRASNRGTKRGR